MFSLSLVYLIQCVSLCCESNTAASLSVNRTIFLFICRNETDSQVFACVHSLDKKIVKYLLNCRNSCHHMPNENKSQRVHTEKKFKLLSNMSFIMYWVWPRWCFILQSKEDQGHTGIAGMTNLVPKELMMTDFIWFLFILLWRFRITLNLSTFMEKYR